MNPADPGAISAVLLIALPLVAAIFAFLAPPRMAARIAYVNAILVILVALGLLGLAFDLT